MREHPMDWGTGGVQDDDDELLGFVQDNGFRLHLHLSEREEREMSTLYGGVPDFAMMIAEDAEYFWTRHGRLLSLSRTGVSEESRQLQEEIYSWLGRSPYLDEVFHNSDLDDQDQRSDADSGSDNDSGNSYVQQYDARGHPINLETRHRERLEVQAGNEVLQVAGIVETCTAREEREQNEYEERLYEKDSGLLWNRLGHRVLTAGMWGVSGLRRRVTLYELYSRIPFSDIVRREKYHYGLSNLITPGLAVEALSHFFRAELLGLEKSFFHRKKSRSGTIVSKLLLVLIKICGFGLEYGRTYLQMFALLQQLNLIEQDKIFLPSLRSFIPFSRDSLIQFPAGESNSFLTNKSGSLFSKVTSLLIFASPMALVYVYGKALPAISNYLFNACYALALKPAVRPRGLQPTSPQGWTDNLTGHAFLQALKNNGFAPCPKRADVRELQESQAIHTLLNSTDITAYYEVRDETTTIHRNEALRILEGGRASEEIEVPEDDWEALIRNGTSPWDAIDSHNNNNDNDDNPGSMQVSWASMISVEVVDHGPRPPVQRQGTNVSTNPVTANASAEVHNATNAPPTPRNALVLKPDDFHITYLTMLPSILLGHTLSIFLSYTIAIPLEILMVRSVASSYLSLHPTSASKWVYKAISIPRLGWKPSLIFVANLMSSHLMVLGVGAVVWTTFSHWSMYFRRRRVSRERGPVEIEVGGWE